MVEKQSQKKIVIGRAGRMIKTIGTRARKEIQRFLDVRRVALELQVSVAPEWRNRERLLGSVRCDLAGRRTPFGHHLVVD